MRPLAHRISSLQVRFVREANDIHIFINQALPLLEAAKEPVAQSTHRKDRRYYVPSLKRVKFARRKDSELQAIYDRFTTHALFETFLVLLISRFEAFLADVIRIVLESYPQKITTSVPEMQPTRSVPVELLWASATLAEALNLTIETQIDKVMFAAPRVQFAYLNAVVGTDTNDDAFQKYLELKATRDLIVHNVGIANPVYLSKAGAFAKWNQGDNVVVTQDYFNAALALTKRLSGIVKRDAEKTFPVTTSDKQAK